MTLLMFLHILIGNALALVTLLLCLQGWVAYEDFKLKKLIDSIERRS